MVNPLELGDWEEILAVTTVSDLAFLFAYEIQMQREEVSKACK